MEPIPDGFDENSESKLVAEIKFVDEIKKLVPDILEHIFSYLGKMFEKIRRGRETDKTQSQTC